MLNQFQIAHYSTRSPIVGHCVDAGGRSGHRGGHACEACGFGIDDFGDGRGFWGEPLVGQKTGADR
jgi:hypothetical protein